MAGTSALLLLQGVSGAAGVTNSLVNAYASRQRGQAEASLYAADVQMARYQAEDAIARGDYEANKVLADARRLAGQQRVGFAASGVKVDVGSAAQVVEDTATLGAYDAAMMKNNALREAFGYKTKEIGARMAARMAKASGRYGAVMSVAQGISGGLQTGLQMSALNEYYRGLGRQTADYGQQSALSMASAGAGVRSFVGRGARF